MNKVPVEVEIEDRSDGEIIGSAEKYIYRVNHEWYVMALTGGVGSEEIRYL